MRECYIACPISDLTSEPEARAQCGSAARWDLCGGRPEPDGVKGRPYRDRKSHYGSRSQRGTGVAALLYSLIESAMLAGVGPNSYLSAGSIEEDAKIRTRG